MERRAMERILGSLAMRPASLWLGPILGVLSSASALAADPSALPKVPEGWKIELVAQAPAIVYPTAIASAADGTIYVGQDPMDMIGPSTSPADSIVAIKPDGSKTIFADKLWAVMGLEWIDGTLFVVHAPYLSAFRDTDGDGKADKRVDLITGLGPPRPGFNGINDHVASGIRRGVDGFLYIAVGDKGIPRAVGTDGASIQLFGGGVIRVRPDGTGLEVVSTGECNPLSVALTATDEIFSYGNDDDSKRWPNSLTHHIVGGYYGYPYQFINRPDRCLSIVAGQVGGVGAQGLCYNEDGLPARYRGNLFFCDWGLRTVFRFEVERAGGTFRVKTREPFVTSGVGDFRPFSLCVANDGRSLYLVDWAYNGWLAPAAKTGRLYRLTCTLSDSGSPAPRLKSDDARSLIVTLDHPALSVRLDAQRRLGERPSTTPSLIDRLAVAKPQSGRLHALWALDASSDPKARVAIRQCLVDTDSEIRSQAARSLGIRGDRTSASGLAALLRDPDVVVRREAAIALGKIGDASITPALLAALGETDAFTAWAIRHAIRALADWRKEPLVAALLDEKRRGDALKLTDEVWSVVVVQALVEAFGKTTDAPTRMRIIENLTGLYQTYPEWTGNWFGTNPLAGEFPRKTKPWNPEAMALVVQALGRGLNDPDVMVRRRALAGLVAQVEGPSAPLLRERLKSETDSLILTGLVEALGRLRDQQSVSSLIKIAHDRSQSISVREAALDALSTLVGAESLRARFDLLYDRQAPPELVARVLPALARERVLPPNDLAAFLDHPKAPIRAAALRAFAGQTALPAAVRAPVVARLEDADPEVRAAAFELVGNGKLAEAVPALLRLSGQPATREAASLALLKTPDARAIGVYLAAIGDRSPELRKEGERALLSLRDQVGAELEARRRKGEFTGPADEAIERILMRFSPVLDWKVIGPFPRATGPLFISDESIDFGHAHTGVTGKAIRWSARRAEAGTGRVAIEDFKEGAGDRGGFGYDANGSPELSAFGYAEFSSDRERTALLLLDSSGPMLVTLNNRIVFNKAMFEGLPDSPETDRARIKLAKGRNRVLVQTRQGIGSWGFSVQVSEPSDISVVKSSATSRLDELRAFALSHEGDASRGRALFLDRKGLGCVKCHSADGRGTSTLGPDLTGLALKYDKAELARSVLEPSNRIATGYQPVIVARKDGKVLSGLVRLENDAFLYLIDAESKITRIPKKDIAERTAGALSIMPVGLADALKPAEFADLIAYLGSLKHPAKANDVR
jgi:putative membrane-bound dehydrogenase-like protein